MDIKLFLTLYPTLMIFFHTFPIQIDPKQRKNIVKAISKIDNKIEILRTIRSLLISFKHSISHFNLVSKFIINAKKQKEENNDAKQSTDI